MSDGITEMNKASRNIKAGELKEYLIGDQPTLRDQFAMAAMTGYMYSESIRRMSELAEQSYLVADAMLKERNKDV
jgi:hypothetical protein